MPTRKRGLQSSVKVENRGGDEHPFAVHVGRNDNALVIPLSLVQPDPEQPRRTFDEASLAELAESIREHGVLQPLIVCKKGDLYHIVAGERRYRAARLAGLDAVPAQVIEDEARIREIQLVENLQREDLGLMEEARALAALQEVLQASVRGLEQATGKSKSYVSRRLALLKMPTDVQEMLERAPHLFSQAESAARIADRGRRKLRIEALLRGPEGVGSTESPRSPGRPVKPFTFKKRRSGAFDLVVKYRPGTSDKAVLIAQLKAAIDELEEQNVVSR